VRERDPDIIVARALDKGLIVRPVARVSNPGRRLHPLPLALFAFVVIVAGGIAYTLVPRPASSGAAIAVASSTGAPISIAGRQAPPAEIVQPVPSPSIQAQANPGAPVAPAIKQVPLSRGQGTVEEDDGSDRFRVRGMVASPARP